VLPNSLMHLVFDELHCGHGIAADSGRWKRPGSPTGGAIPYSFNFLFPSSLIQSVVQAGAKTVVIFILVYPFSSNAILIFMVIISMAGQPVYVGVITTSISSPLIFTSLTMPRSVMVKTGISGSVTCSRISRIFCVSMVDVVTTRHLDKFAAGIAFLLK